jgi:hypothetical protein
VRWYYALWQLLALRKGRALLKRRHHDVAHHVSLMGPGFVMVPYLPVPSVVGPFGGLQPLVRGFEGVARHPLLESGRKIRNSMRKVSPLWRWQLSRTNALIVANTATRALLPPTARRRSFLMQIGTDEILPESETASQSSDDIGASERGGTHAVKVLWGGVQVGWKGLELLIRALPLVKEAAETSIELMITGTGPDRAYFESLVDQLGLRDSTRFLGWVSRDTYRSLLKSCDIFIFTSLRETTGAALLEAMGQGKPTVVIDHGGPADIATEATSIKVKPESPGAAIEGLAEGLRILISDPGLRRELGGAAHRRIRDTYSWPAVVHETLRIYRSVLTSEPTDRP